MKVKIKMLYPDATPPKYAHPGDACADVYAFSTVPDDNDNLVDLLVMLLLLLFKLML